MSEPISEFQAAMNRHMSLCSAEREVLEACVEEQVYTDAMKGKDIAKMHGESRFKASNKFVGLANARVAAIRRYRALLDGKEAK